MTDLFALLKQMTLEEKAALCVGASPWSTVSIERLGIPSLVMTDGPHGVRLTADPLSMASESLPATCFPSASCLASTWDPALMRAMGVALGEEALALGVGILLGPGTNIKRSPLGGRNFEYFSEDPFLAGEMAAALIDGIQSQGVGTSLKHFAANNQEYRRFVIDAQIDERTLREIYLPAFENAVVKSQSWSVMCAYNKLNGTLCSEHASLLTGILKTEWGFEGLVVSDWGAVRDRVKSLSAGLDLEMPGPQPRRVRAVIEALKAGALDQSVLDETVLRILRIVFKAAETPKGGMLDVDGHHAVARKIAGEGMVLLKNNGILPLKNPQRVAVIGNSAMHAYYQGGGASHINPTRLDSPYAELQKVGGQPEFTFAQGYLEDGSSDPGLIAEAAGLAKSAGIALIFIGLPPLKESEGYDRTDLDLSPQQVDLIRAVAAVQPACVVILNNGSPLVMSAWIEGVGAVLEAWMMGQAGAGAIADVLFGKTNPSGKLAETFPLKLTDTPAYINWPGENSAVRYGEGIFVGYRYYNARQIPVQFPFGYGLSYTSFSYANARLSSTICKDTDGLTISVDVTNTGKMAGKEIVQVYLHDQKSSLVRPPQELKGFAKLELQPGESKTASIPLGFRSFAFYNPRYQQWITEDGDFDVLIGSSSADIRCSLTVTIKSTLVLPCKLDRESTIREWLEDPRGKNVLGPIFQKMSEQMAAQMGADHTPNNSIGMDMLGFMLDMPLVKVLAFQERALPVPADEFVTGLLAQVRG